MQLWSRRFSLLPAKSYFGIYYSQQKSETEWLLAFQNKIQTQKGSKERLFTMTRTHTMQTFGQIPFVKPPKRHFNNR